jgi:DNA-binding SARP family transcriptional activator
MMDLLSWATCSVRLLNRFGFCVADHEPRLGAGSQRLLALLALHENGLDRRLLARDLYPEVEPQRAAQSLRTALWRLQRCCPAVVQVSPTSIRLAPEVAVDLRAAIHCAKRLVDPSVQLTADELRAATGEFGADMLPDWHDDWLVLERERFRLLRLEALEALCERLTGMGWYGAAIDAGLAAVAADPLRESAHRLVVRAHLAEGNLFEARRQVRQCQQLMRRELGLDPAAELLDVLRDTRLAPSA